MVGKTIKAVRICRGYLKQEARSVRTIWVVFLFFIFSNIFTEEILNFSKTTGYGITPWIGIFFTTTRFARLITYVIFLLVISNLPFREENDIYFLIRSGRFSFCMGNLFYVFVNAGAASFFLLFLSGIWGIGTMEWSPDWGKVLGTLAMTDAGSQFNHSVIVGSKLITNFAPANCAVLVFFLQTFCFFFLGQLYIVCNLLSSKRNYGLFVCGILILFDFMVQSEPTIWRASYFSPVTWSNLACLDLKRNVSAFPSVTYAVVMYFIIDIALAAVVLRLSKYLKIGESEEKHE